MRCDDCRQDITPGLLLEIVLLLGGVTAITAWTEGRPGLRRLYGGIRRWRIGFGRYAVLLLAMPLLTLGVGAVTGTLHSPDGGWLKLILVRHALKNALLPVITVIALEFAFLLGGLVVTEQVFNLKVEDALKEMDATDVARHRRDVFRTADYQCLPL